MNIGSSFNRLFSPILSVILLRRLNVERFGRVIWFMFLTIFVIRIAIDIVSAYLWMSVSPDTFKALGHASASQYTIVISSVVSAAWAFVYLLAARFVLEVSIRLLRLIPADDVTKTAL
jgi:hypothetical protein